MTRLNSWVERGRNPDDSRRDVYDAALEALRGANPPTLWAPTAERILDEIAEGEHAEIADDGDAILDLILDAETAETAEVQS